MMADYQPNKPSPYYFEIDPSEGKPGLYYQPPAEQKGRGENAAWKLPKPTWISGVFEVAARTRDSDSENHGLLLQWYDLDKQLHEWLMPKALLAGDGMEIRRTLLNGGLDVSSKKNARDHLMAFLGESRPEKTVRSVTTIGWQPGGFFVLPNKTIGGS